MKQNKFMDLLRDKSMNVTLSIGSQELREFFEYLIDTTQATKTHTPLVLDKKGVAELTGYSINTINKKVSDQTIPCYKREGRVLFNRTEIENWLMANRQPTLAEYAEQHL